MYYPGPLWSSSRILSFCYISITGIAMNSDVPRLTGRGAYSYKECKQKEFKT